jgi:hypothetical protein
MQNLSNFLLLILLFFSACVSKKQDKGNRYLTSSSQTKSSESDNKEINDDSIKIEVNDTTLSQEIKTDSDISYVNFIKTDIDDKKIISALKVKFENKEKELLFYTPQLIGKKTFLLNGISYVLVALGFQNTETCHACTGENDIALLKVENDRLVIVDYLAGADFGGYGIYSDVLDYHIFGKENVCVFLEGCGQGMGFDACFVKGFGIINNKIIKIVEFHSALYEYDLYDENEKVLIDYDRKYKFKKESGSYYDLIWMTNNNLNGKKHETKLLFDESLKSYKE